MKKMQKSHFVTFASIAEKQIDFSTKYFNNPSLTYLRTNQSIYVTVYHRVPGKLLMKM